MTNLWGSSWRRVVVWIVGCSAIVLACITLCISLYSRYWYPRIYAFWIIFPPSWFFIEYHFVFNRKEDPDALDRFKVGQDVAQKFWAALILLLAGVGYFRWNFSLH
jgi:hypothetical protein